MSLLVTDAIVLHAFDYLESSRIIRLLTREAGVQSALARGARKSRGQQNQSKMVRTPLVTIQCSLTGWIQSIAMAPEACGAVMVQVPFASSVHQSSTRCGVEFFLDRIR